MLFLPKDQRSVSLFWEKASEFCSALDCEIRKNRDAEKDGGRSGVLDITEWNRIVTLDIIGVAGLGNDPQVLKDPDSDWYQHYRLALLPSKGARQARLLAALLPGALSNCLPLKRVEQYQISRAAVETHIMKLLTAKCEAFDRGEGKDESDMIAQAIRSGVFSDANLLDQSMTIITAGHETTSTALSWTTYLLTQHPDIQEHLRKEIRSDLPSPSDSSPMSAETLDALPYLHAVCNEGMRLYSPVPMIPPSAVIDTTLLGISIPKGTNVRASPWASSKSEHLWGGSALEFNLDRWLEGGASSKGGTDSHYNYMAFSQGARNCIVASFAKVEFAACLAALIGRFDIKLEQYGQSNEVEILHGITAKPGGEMRARLTIVDSW